jgi:type IV pilus assembly protein PilW
MNRQQGLTLISLMVAMVIGLFLIAGVLVIYQNSKNSFNVRGVVSEVYENQRFAIDDLRRLIVMTGRSITGAEDTDENYRAIPPLTASLADAVASGGEFIYDGGVNESDIIAVRYRRGPSCGDYQNVASDTRPTMVRFLVDDGDLICELTTYSGGAATTRQTIASGIERLKVLYGVDETDDFTANRYLTAPEVDALDVPAGSNTPWSRVVSMRVGLIAGSQTELPRGARKAAVDTLSLMGMDVVEPDTAHLFRVASTTIVLRNFNPVVTRQ